MTKRLIKSIMLIATSLISFATIATTVLRIHGHIKSIDSGRALLQTQSGDFVKIDLSKLTDSERKRVTKAVGSKEEFRIALVPEQIAKD